MKTLTILMILGNGSSIIGVLSNLGTGNAISIILGLLNVILSGGVIFLLGSWMCDDANDEKRKGLVKGLLINVGQTVLQLIVMAIFASQYGAQLLQAARDSANSIC